MSAKVKTVYVCSNCGEESLTWQGKCPVCGEWNTFKELRLDPARRGQSKSSSSLITSELKPLDLQANELHLLRLPTGFQEFNRVLGGGIIPGSVILLGGEPGIGKSTLLLQTAQNLSQDIPVIYFSGEESAGQVAGRAARLGLTPTFLFANETRLPVIKDQITAHSPKIVIIDSIQTLYDDTYPSTPGSLVQVRECALQLQELAKSQNITVILVGHITKEGTVAGPKTLEHMVDVVLYLEGESRSEMRILRSIKNRFGATYEVGLFELGDKGLKDITDPSGLFVEDHPSDVPGTALTAVLEGARPILVEIQALVVPTAFGYPKRTSSGLDIQRLHILLAILDSRVRGAFGACDVFLNVVGGYKIQDRAADLAVCMALLSAASHISLPPKQVFYGEVGLTGEIRKVTQQTRREEEMKRLGYVSSPTVRTIPELAKEFNVQKIKKSE